MTTITTAPPRYDALGDVLTFTPRHVLRRGHERPSRNVLHDILDRPDPDVSLAVGGTRAGVLRLLCDDYAHGLAGEEYHAQASVFTLDDPEQPGASMAYVTTGPTRFDVTDTERTILEVPFRQVLL